MLVNRASSWPETNGPKDLGKTYSILESRTNRCRTKIAVAPVYKWDSSESFNSQRNRKYGRERGKDGVGRAEQGRREEWSG